MYVARRLTFDAINEIARQVRPGMSEGRGGGGARESRAQAVRAAARLARGLCALRPQYAARLPRHVRAGSGAGAEHGIFASHRHRPERWERVGRGDGGDTFVVGNDAREMHRAKTRDIRVLFGRVQDKWRADSLTGSALYDYAEAQARALGWLLNLKSRTSPRRLPHKAHHSGSLAATGFVPTSRTCGCSRCRSSIERPRSARSMKTCCSNRRRSQL